MSTAAAAQSTGGSMFSHPAVSRYWHIAGRNTRMVIVSIGSSKSNAIRSRALVLRATRLGMPVDQQVWGQGMAIADCYANMKELDAAADVFAVLLLPDAPVHINVRSIRRQLQSYKDLIRPGAWHGVGPVRPGEIEFLLNSAISAHQTHGKVICRCDAHIAR